MRSVRAGFTLIELIIAVGLAAAVVVGLGMIVSSMVRFQTEGLRKNVVSAWSLASMSRMNKEIEDSSVLVAPTSAVPNGDSLQGCTNWTRLGTGGADGGPLDPALPTTVFYYCYDAPNKLLRRYAKTGICPTVRDTLGCNTATVAGWPEGDVLALNVNYFQASPASAPLDHVFSLDAPIQGVRVRYLVGKITSAPQAGTPDVVNPQFVAVNLAIPLERQYVNTSD